MPGVQVLADSRSAHLVDTPIRLIVETRPAVPRFLTLYSVLCFAIYMSSVGESHTLPSLFRSSNFPYVFQNFLLHILMLWLYRYQRTPCMRS